MVLSSWCYNTNLSGFWCITSASSVVAGIVTTSSTGNDAGAGIITASFVGSGEGLTGVASTDNIITGTATTFTAGVNISGSSSKCHGCYYSNLL